MAVRDPFLAKKRLDPDQVIKSVPVPVEKMWSDEAREAAALARQHGWQSSHVSGKISDGSAKEVMTHPDHPNSKLSVGDQGWEMRHGPKGQKPGGFGSHAEMKPYLEGFHGGPPQGEHARALKDFMGHLGGEPNEVDVTPRRKPTWSKSAGKSAYTTVGKQAPVGPRVIEVDGDQDSIAREYELLRPGCVTDEAEEGKPLMVPDADPEDYGETPLAPSRAEKLAKAWSDEARAAAAEARRHGATLHEHASDAEKDGNDEAVHAFRTGAAALSGAKVNPRDAAKARATLGEHMHDAEKDGNQELVAAAGAAREKLLQPSTYSHEDRFSPKQDMRSPAERVRGVPRARNYFGRPNA